MCRKTKGHVYLQYKYDITCDNSHFIVRQIFFRYMDEIKFLCNDDFTITRNLVVKLEERPPRKIEL